MKNLQKALSGVLALQLVLAAGLFWDASAQQQAAAQPALLVQTEPEQLRRLEITGDDDSVTLARVDGQWQLPGLHDLPVNGEKLDTLLDKLTALKGIWPVATSSSARERFEVAEEKFRKRLKLYTGEGGEPALELYLGTSPGFRKVHLRRADDDAIYAVELNSFDLPAKADSWLDTSLLAAGALERIQGPDYALEKGDDGWRFAKTSIEASTGNGSEQQAPAVDSGKVRNLAAALETLRITAPVPEAPQVEETEILVQSGSGELRYYFAHADDKYFVRRSDRAQVFEITKHDFDRVVPQRFADLVLVEWKDSEQTAEGESEAVADDGAQS